MWRTMKLVLDENGLMYDYRPADVMSVAHRHPINRKANIGRTCCCCCCTSERSNPDAIKVCCQIVLIFFRFPFFLFYRVFNAERSWKFGAEDRIGLVYSQVAKKAAQTVVILYYYTSHCVCAPSKVCRSNISQSPRPSPLPPTFRQQKSNGKEPDDIQFNFFFIKKFR